MGNESLGHQKILERILFNKEITKKDLAIRIGYSETNYPLTFNKPIYSNKLIEKICKELEIEESVFYPTNNMAAESNVMYGGKIITIDERDYFEQRLKDKNKIIELLEERIEELKKSMVK